MGWNYSPKEFIKVYRKFMEWEWYTDVNVTKLFLHCLLRANWKSGNWQGINYKAGEFITSLPSLSEETGLSIQQIRTALDKLISTGELTSRTTDSLTGRKLSKSRIIAVNNWDNYQSDNRQSNSISNRQSTGQQQDSNRIVTGKQQDSNSRYKNNKNNKNNKNIKEEPAALPSEDDNDDGIDPMEAMRIWNERQKK